MNADQILDRIKDCNIYDIRKIMGVQCIKVLGYFYPMDGIWKHVIVRIIYGKSLKNP